MLFGGVSRWVVRVEIAVSILGVYDDRDKTGESNMEANAAIALTLCAKTPTIVAAYHRFRNGLELPPICEDLTEAQHFLYLVNGEVPTDMATHILDVALILHADLCHLADLRLDRSRSRATRRQPPLPSAHPLHRPENPKSGAFHRIPLGSVFRCEKPVHRAVRHGSCLLRRAESDGTLIARPPAE